MEGCTVLTMRVLAVLALMIRIERASAFFPRAFLPNTAVTGRSVSVLESSSCSSRRSIFALKSGKSNEERDSDDSDKAKEAGMEAAFRQLDALESLGEEEAVADYIPPLTPPDDAPVPATEEVSPEKEVQMYKDMVKELEQQDEEDLYSNVLADMGGTSRQTKRSDDDDDTTYSDDIADMGGTPKQPSTSSSPKLSIESDDETNDTEDFLNQALEEALKEVKVNNPDMASSILDDKEIMQEIEQIFDRGNEKLMASLEEIRQEQSDLAKASANQNAQSAADTMAQDQARLAQAEASMEAMLGRVSKEQEAVNQAVQELQRVQAEIDRDPLVKLKQGGIPKQAALAGFLLFSVRSILDTVASFSDESHLTAALIQGGIALVCAAIYFLF